MVTNDLKQELDAAQKAIEALADNLKVFASATLMLTEKITGASVDSAEVAVTVLRP